MTISIVIMQVAVSVVTAASSNFIFLSLTSIFIKLTRKHVNALYISS